MVARCHILRLRVGVSSLSVAIIFIGYALQTRFRPFMDQLDLDIAADSVDHIKVDGAVLNYVRTTMVWCLVPTLCGAALLSFVVFIVVLFRF